MTNTRGIFCSGPSAGALRALSEAGSSSTRHRLPRRAQRRHRCPRPAPIPRSPRVSQGGGDPGDHKGRAPRAHLKRGESLIHSSNSTVMAAAARGAHWHEDRGAPSGILGRPGPPVRPPAPRSAPRARPPRNEAAAPPPRPACHCWGASPKSAARARRPLSPSGSVAKVRGRLAPPAVTAGERRQTPHPVALGTPGSHPGAPTSRPPSFPGHSGSGR